MNEILTCRKGNSILWRNAVPTKRGSRKWQGQLWVVVAVVVTDMSKRQLHTVEERRADKNRFKEKATAALGQMPPARDLGFNWYPSWGSPGDAADVNRCRYS
eukprot:g18481.t1